jgi:hypothetical protein
LRTEIRAFAKFYPIPISLLLGKNIIAEEGKGTGEQKMSS